MAYYASNIDPSGVKSKSGKSVLCGGVLVDFGNRNDLRDYWVNNVSQSEQWYSYDNKPSFPASTIYDEETVDDYGYDNYLYRIGGQLSQSKDDTVIEAVIDLLTEYEWAPEEVTQEIVNAVEALAAIPECLSAQVARLVNDANEQNRILSLGLIDSYSMMVADLMQLGVRLDEIAENAEKLDEIYPDWSLHGPDGVLIEAFRS